MRRRDAVYVAVGLCFGFMLLASGLARYDVIHRMLRFEDWDPYLIMASSIGTAMPLLWLLERRGWVTPFGGALSLKRLALESRRIYGGMVFGVGWAITGACPGTVSAMIGGGCVLGLAILGGVFLGLRAHMAMEEAQTGRAVVARAQARPEPAVAQGAGAGS